MKLSKKEKDLIQFISSTAEKANEDLALGFFRDIFGKKFNRQKEAERSDGYVAGNFVLELKGNTDDWLAGLLQGLAYGKELDFNKVVIAAPNFLGVWFVTEIPEDILDEVSKAKDAPNAIGKKLAKKFKSRNKELLKVSTFLLESSYLPTNKTLFSKDSLNLKQNLERFVEVLHEGLRKRQRITLKNFTSILKGMRRFFEEDQPLLVVRAFYSIIFGWNEGSKVQISERKLDSVSVGGEVVSGLKPDQRVEFKRFVENHYVSDDKVPSKDVFFEHFDQALDALDPEFRIKHGIFFTDQDLARFSMWFIKRKLGDIGKNYMVIDPACGSGNLVTNWRSPLELRHKVVSEIEPELLFAIERRMQGDEWHNGKFTVVPKVSEARGLNFLDKSAEEYLGILKGHLKEKGLKPDKPIAFLCNPPYRNDDDQTATSIAYDVHPSIVALTGKDGSSERFCCFLAQMKLICQQAESSGLPGESLLLLFTQGSWLTDRLVYKKIRAEIFGSFENKGGFIVNSKEFFEVKGKFPIAFTVWKYAGNNRKISDLRPINLIDLTWMKKDSLKSIHWDQQTILETECEDILNNRRSIEVSFGSPKENIISGSWVGFSRRNLYRNLTNLEKKEGHTSMGLPRGDLRTTKKTIYGRAKGQNVGFMLDLTPCRTNIEAELQNKPWFYLDNRFMRVRTVRCFSGQPANYGFCPQKLESTTKMVLWYALARTFASEGYPIWANQMEMWAFKTTPEIVRIAYAICFAENECVETVFPANNPINGVQELYVSNPMSPNSKTSFWSTSMKHVFDKASSLSHELVDSVNSLYSKWKKHLGPRPEIIVTYKKAYFIGKGKLNANSGIVQIRDYIKENDVKDLLQALDLVQGNLSNLKKQFYKMLISKDQINYFGQPKVSAQTNKPTVQIPSERKSKFQGVLDLRITLSAYIVNQLQDDPNMGRTKFAKVLYLTEQATDLDLQTQYYREAAGPLDQRILYNEKIGIETVAEKLGCFSAKKSGKRIKYLPGENLGKSASEFADMKEGKKSIDEVNRVIKLIYPMNTDQIEIVSTLYAAWNDLLIKAKGKSITDDQIIDEFLNKWHERKRRFAKNRLVSALGWMRKKNLVPKGKGKLTQVKDDINF